MKRGLILIVLCFQQFIVNATELELSSPVEFQVVQRASKRQGVVPIAGSLIGSDRVLDLVEAKLTVDGVPGDSNILNASIEQSQFRAQFEVPAGGWYRIHIRVKNNNVVIAESSVEHIGVGEVFVIAGQSNSANHGEERLSPKSGKVAAFDGERWRPANDPQPWASGGGGSFIPPFGDSIAQQFGVPVGIVACGIGATSIREWLPEGARFPNPPTLLERVRSVEGSEWECKGEAFETLIKRLKKLGPHGFRAVLWHQGESDANQQDASRTLAGSLYREYLGKLIRETRREIGWESPWFVAQATYHVPGDESSPEIRAAQASLWVDGIALQGPDTDTIKGEMRDSGGKGVHFSGLGQREHAARWIDKVAPWLDDQLSDSPSTRPMIGRLAAARILFLGNSITLHGPKPDIGWNGNWGMAASSEQLDYVHLIAANIAEATQSKPSILVRNIADFERDHETFDIEKTLTKEITFKPDIVIIAIGENVPELTTDDAKTKYATAFQQLLKTFQRQGQTAIFVRSSFWLNAAKDGIMRRASVDAGASFIDIGQLGQIEANFARSEKKFDHAGVAAHPGDKGMRAIADAILTAIQDRAKFAIQP